MPLSDPKPRKLRHSRRIELDGYQREDGLWDVEARLVDAKAYDFDNRCRGWAEDSETVRLMYPQWHHERRDDAD